MLKNIPITALVFLLFTGCAATPDRELMWETTALKGIRALGDPAEPKASTEAAIEAAGRFFETSRFLGKTREEVVAIAGDPRRSSDSMYNFPFYPVKDQSALVYRFDTGCGGYQINMHFDASGKVSRLEKIGIE